MIGIFSSLLPLMILGGLVYAVFMMIKSSTDGDAAEPIDGGEAAKSAVIHIGLFVAFIACVVGFIDLFQYALEGRNQLAGTSSDLARGLAFLIVGLPATALLIRAVDGRYRSRSETGDDRAHRGWTVYLIAALTTGLIGTLVSIGLVIDDLTSKNDTVEASEVVQLLVWFAFWVSQWFVLRPRFNVRGDAHLAIGTVVGLSWMLTGAAGLIYRVLADGYDSAFSGSLLTDYRLSFWALVTIVGLVVWCWYWWAHFTADGAATRSVEGDRRRSPLWYFTVVAAGVLPGFATMLGAAVVAISGMLIWFVGETNKDAAEYFEPSPAVATALIIGTITWAYHRWELERGGPAVRNEALRFHDYAVVGLALVTVVGAFAALVSLLIEALAVRSAFAGLDSERNALIVVTTLLAIAAATWWRFWAKIEQARRNDSVDEADSIWRKLYLIVGFGVAGLVLAVSLIWVLFAFLLDLLEGDLSRQTLRDLKGPLGWAVAVAGAVWYHLDVWRVDRATIERSSVSAPKSMPSESAPPARPRDIRVATSEDFGQIYSLQRAAFLDEAITYATLSVPSIEETLDESNARLAGSWTLVAVEGTRIIGSVSVRSYREGGADIERLMVAPDMRRRGVATHLLTAMETALAGEGHTVVQLIVGEIVHEARALYERQGYELVSREQSPGGPALLTLRKFLI